MTKRGIPSVNLQTRYPEIGFFLSFFPHKATKLPQNGKKLEKWLETQKLDDVDLLYIVGLIGYSLPEQIAKWLSEKKERALVFIEENLGAFASFDDETLLANPQVHLCYAKEDSIEGLAQDFPTDRLAIFAGKKFDAERLKRRSAAFSALYSDILYSHKIVDNVLKNFQRLPICFDGRQPLAKIPLIICGAGPSLAKAIPLLKKYKDRALILAGGSAITALTKNGLQPHLAMALDPNDEEFDRLRQSTFFEGPYLFSPRLHKDVFATANGPYGYLRTDTGGLVENFLEEKLPLPQTKSGPDLGSEAFSVTTLALSWAYAMGFSEILFTGVDLAYTGGARYAPGVEADPTSRENPQALEQIVVRRDIHGKKVETLLKWVMESDCISAFAKERPEMPIANCAGEGLGFEGIPNHSLEEKLRSFPQRDLRGLLHQWTQSSPLTIKTDQIDALFQQLEASLENCKALATQILSQLEKQKETGKLVLFQSDFKEEIAYKALLEGIDRALDHLLYRYYPHIDPTLAKWAREKAKYHEILRQIALLQDICKKTRSAHNLPFK